VRTQDKTVTCDVNGVFLWRVHGPEVLMEVRCSALPDGTVVAVCKGNETGTAYVTVDGRALRSAAPVFGVQSVAVEGAWLYLMRSATVLEVLSVSGEIVDMRAVMPTSQGIRDVVDGEVRMADDWYVRQVGTLRLHQVVARPGIMIGQADPSQIAGEWQGGYFTAIEGVAFEPHLAALDNGRFAICARTPAGAALAIVPPYPALVTGSAPLPDPQPEPRPMPQPDVARLTDTQFATLERERAKFSAETLTPEEIGIILNATAFAHRHDPDQQLGLQRKDHGTRAIQPVTGVGIWNGLRIIRDGTHYGGDVCGSCSIGRFVPVRADFLPAEPVGPNGFVEPVMTSAQPTPDPAPAPNPAPPAADLGPVLAQLVEINNALGLLLQGQAQLSEQFAALRALVIRPTPTPAPAVSFPDYQARILGQTVTLRPMVKP
jgi:hypothetical protein